MTVDSVNILFGWYDEDKSCLEWLKKEAEQGDKDCLADYLGIRTEFATSREEVEANMAELKKLSDEGVARANLVIGVLYNEGLCKENPEIFLPQDDAMSDFYLSKAAEKNDTLALFILGMHVWLRSIKAPAKQDLENGKKWIKKLIALADDNSIDPAHREYAQNHLETVKGWLEALEDK